MVAATTAVASQAAGSKRDSKAVRLSIDLSPLSCDCAEHALSALTKALSEDGGDIWSPHENAAIRALVEEFTQDGLARFSALREELLLWLGGKYQRHVAAALSSRVTPVMPMYRWGAEELGRVESYLTALPTSVWAMDDYGLLVEYLFQRYLPDEALVSDAQWLTTKAHLMGRAQANIHDAITPVVAERIAAALPATPAEALGSFDHSTAQKAILEYGNARACENVRALSDAARHKMRAIVMDNRARSLAGDKTATVSSLQSDLLDTIGTMNRDWRRIAVTEAGECANQGLLATLSAGTRVRRMEMYHGACAFCRKIDGSVLTVVEPDAEKKDGKTQVWVGKTNIGRSGSPRKKTPDGLVDRTEAERWWIPAGTVHPHCRGYWDVLSAMPKGADPVFAAWLDKTLGIVQ